MEGVHLILPQREMMNQGESHPRWSGCLAAEHQNFEFGETAQILQTRVLHAAAPARWVCKPWRKSTAFCACAAALKMARLSFLRTASHSAM